MAYTGKKPVDHTDVTQSQSMTVTDDLTVDTNTLHVDSTNNRVGIGTTSPSSDAIVKFLEIEDSTSAGVVLDAARVYSIYSSSSSTLAFRDETASANRMTIDSSGNLLVGGDTFDNGAFSASSNGINVFDNFPIVNLVETGGNTSFYMGKTGSLNYFGTADAQDILFLTNDTTRMRLLAGGGLTFNGDTAAANALSDYEEGTWTPTVAAGTVNAGNARYTKIGDLVHITCLVSTFSDRTTATNLRISGLPFTSSSATNSVSAVLGRYADVGGDAIVNWMAASSSTLYFYTTLKGGNYSTVNHNNLNSSNAAFYVSHTYKA